MAKIGIDIDSTLAEVAPALCSEIYWLTGKAVLPEDMMHWDTWLVEWGLAYEDFKQAFITAWRDHWQNIPACEAALPASLQRIKDGGHMVIVITSQWQSSWVVQTQWLERQGLLESTDALIQGEHTDFSKWDYVDVLIDDAPKRAEDVPEEKMLYLVDRPWNQGIEDSERVKRVTTVAQAVGLLTGLTLADLDEIIRQVHESGYDASY